MCNTGVFHSCLSFQEVALGDNAEKVQSMDVQALDKVSDLIFLTAKTRKVT